MHQGSSAGKTERRRDGAIRVAFNAQVDVGGEYSAPFSASAVDLSRQGLHLTGPVLPELGEPLACRFAVGDQDVICEGTVVWRQEGHGDDGHEFGLRFAALDEQSATLLSNLLSGYVAPNPEVPATRLSPAPQLITRGSRVFLHIEGLAAPMHARVRGTAEAGLLAQSALGFLQLGKEIELEDTKSGHKLGARIEQVEIEIDAKTGVPQLVVSLAYPGAASAEDLHDTDPHSFVASGPIAPIRSTEEPRALVATTPRAELLEGHPETSEAVEAVDADPASAAPAEAELSEEDRLALAMRAGAARMAREAAEANHLEGEHDEREERATERSFDEPAALSAHANEDEAAPRKNPLAGTMAKITPAVLATSQAALGKGKEALAKVTLLWQKRGETDAKPATRRTTAPPPGSASAAPRMRQQNRGASAAASQATTSADTPKAQVLAFAKQHKRKLGAGTALVAAGALAAFAFSGGEEKPLATMELDSIEAEEEMMLPEESTPTPAPAPAAPPPAKAAAKVAALDPTQLPLANDSVEEVEEEAPRVKRVARPFGRGKIENGKAFRLKMDGPIEEIQGAQLAEGFTITLPERRSLEGAAALFKADPRVARAKIENNDHGAELEVTFKDGTPAYVARARGEVLEVVLSNPEKKSDSKSSNDKAQASSSKSNSSSTSSKAPVASGSKSSSKGGLEPASARRSR